VESMILTIRRKIRRGGVCAIAKPLRDRISRQDRWLKAAAFGEFA
jgi:hypothetical protein